MIKSFRCKDTEALFKGGRLAKNLRPIARVAARKLDMIDYAETLGDLRVPPGNRLEALRGKRQGQHSIRINGQWRVCFVWRANGAHEVEIVDYH
ncbi:MAG: type II toxin-antitoxin system RelE/ParE family toxin [Alphaproteobacteria bacterium]